MAIWYEVTIDQIFIVLAILSFEMGELQKMKDIIDFLRS